MKKIIAPEKVSTISHKLSAIGKTIVLAGGCFDILHPGHLAFLEAAKKTGDHLFLLLENDERIRMIKGEKRPWNTQYIRAENLSKISFVDDIIMLPSGMTNAHYDEMIMMIKPAIIATTKGDTAREHKIRQAKKVHGVVIEVIDRLTPYSTTQILKTYE